MKKVYSYPARINKDEDGRFVLTFPDFGWGATDGATLEEALEEGKDLLRELLTTHIRLGELIPKPHWPVSVCIDFDEDEVRKEEGPQLLLSRWSDGAFIPWAEFDKYIEETPNLEELLCTNVHGRLILYPMVWQHAKHGGSDLMLLSILNNEPAFVLENPNNMTHSHRQMAVNRIYSQMTENLLKDEEA